MTWKDQHLIYGLLYRYIGLMRIIRFFFSIYKDFYFSFQNIMNFTFEVRKPPDGNYGALKPDGTWTGMIGELIIHNADIGIMGLKDFSDLFYNIHNSHIIKIFIL